MGNDADVWSAVYRLDAARLVRIVLEQAPADHFEMPFAIFAQINAPASSVRARKRFGRVPTEPGLIADIALERYFAVAASR